MTKPKSESRQKVAICTVRVSLAEADGIRKAAKRKGLSLQEFILRGGVHALRMQAAEKEAGAMRAAGLL